MPSAPIPSFPWSGTTPGSAGPYSAAQFAAFIAGLYNRQADTAEQGVAPWSGLGALAQLGLLVGYGFDVSALASPNMSVNIGPGAASVNGTWVNNIGTTYNLAIGSNVSGNPRIDTVVLHADYTAQTIVATVLQGTPGGLPTPPGLTQSTLIWEIPLADIAVANGAASITQANITPRQVPINAPDGVYMLVKNNSGATLQTGDVVVWDNTTQQAVKTSTTQNDPTVAGVMIGRTTATKFGLMVVKGVAWVHVNGAVSNGQLLSQSTTAAQAVPSNLNAGLGVFAYAMSAVAGAGLMPAYVDASQIAQSNIQYLSTTFNSSYRAAGRVYQNSGTDYSLAVATTWTTVDAANFALTVTPTGTRVVVQVQFSMDWTSVCDVSFDFLNSVSAARSQAGNIGVARVVIGTSFAPILVQSFQAEFVGLTPGTPVTFSLQYFLNSGTAKIRRNSYPTFMTAHEF